VRLARAFPNLRRAIQSGEVVRIIAIGSSSTAGRGDVLPYPYWLERGLREQFKSGMIYVINRGVGGEDAPEELDRLRQAAAERPAMIIWQVGSNAIFHETKYSEGQVAEAIATGLSAICRPGLDVMVMDQQYAPALLRPDKCKMTLALVQRIAEIVEARGDGDLQLFRRFALMRYWHEIDRISFDRMIDPTDSDRLHQSEWSTRAVTQALCQALAEAVQ
jgi:hypothetical protein